mmetsp:Transcript_45961/g.141566  ORF Transcript_45961/g.141566 Transcript_45961/m.141566 type:complete len:241 (-) Transcript_45961:207-929(-)
MEEHRLREHGGEIPRRAIFEEHLVAEPIDAFHAADVDACAGEQVTDQKVVQQLGGEHNRRLPDDRTEGGAAKLRGLGTGVGTWAARPCVLADHTGQIAEADGAVVWTVLLECQVDPRIMRQPGIAQRGTQVRVPTNLRQQRVEVVQRHRKLRHHRHHWHLSAFVLRLLVFLFLQLRVSLKQPLKFGAVAWLRRGDLDWLSSCCPAASSGRCGRSLGCAARLLSTACFLGRLSGGVGVEVR